MENSIHNMLIAKLQEITKLESEYLFELIYAFEKKYPNEKSKINLLKDYDLKGKIDDNYAKFILNYFANY